MAMTDKEITAAENESWSDVKNGIATAMSGREVRQHIYAEAVLSKGEAAAAEEWAGKAETFATNAETAADSVSGVVDNVSEIRKTFICDSESNIDIFSDFGKDNKTGKTGGISYEYDAETRSITANGTLSSTTSNFPLAVISLPAGAENSLAVGNTYNLTFNTSISNLHYRVSYFNEAGSECATFTEIYYSGGTFTIPEDKGVVTLRIYCTYRGTSGDTVSDEISAPSIYSFDSLKTRFDGALVGPDVMDFLGVKTSWAKKTETKYGITFTWADDGSYVDITGTLDSSQTLAQIQLYTVTKPLPACLVAGETYDFSFKLDSYTPADLNTVIDVVFLDKNQSTIRELYLTAYSTTFTIPTDCVGIKIQLFVLGTLTYSSTGPNHDNNEYVEMNTRAYMPSIYWHPAASSVCEKVDALNDAVFGNEENPLAEIRKDTGFLDCFKAVGVIGDSLASGSAHYASGSGEPPEFKATSWPQFLARMTGNTYYNFTKGGMNTKKWVNGYATDLLDGNPFDGNHNCTAYIIGLGENDCTKVLLQENETGTDDIGDSTKETFYRYYGEIIQMIRDYKVAGTTSDNKAKIFCLTNPTTSRLRAEYNEAIRNIVKFFHDEKGYPVYLIDLYKYGIDYYYSEWIRKHGNYRTGHFNAVSYRYMANIIATYIDWFIKNNPEEFNQIEFIGTDYSY